MREVEGIEFKEEFAGDEKYGYHLSPDGFHLVQDDWDNVFALTVETEKYAYFHHDEDVVMFGKNDMGVIDELISDNYFASVGLTETMEELWTGAGDDKLVWSDAAAQQYIREFARDYEWPCKKWKAADVPFTEVSLLGMKALYTNFELDKSSVPKPLRVYEVRQSDKDWIDPGQIVKCAYANRSGTLITIKPLDLYSPELTKVNLQETLFRPSAPKSLDGFMRDHSIKTKPQKALER